jgi:hypothetical protein
MEVFNKLKQGKCPEPDCQGKLEFVWINGWLHLRCSDRSKHNRKATTDEWSCFITGEI